MAATLSRRRPGHTYDFAVGTVQATLTVTEAPDGQPAEIFLRADKQGSTMAGLCESLAIATTLTLQQHAPVGVLVHRLLGERAADSGATGDPEVPAASSLPDYVARRLAVDYL